MSQQTGHWGISVAIRTDSEVLAGEVLTRLRQHTEQGHVRQRHRAGISRPAPQPVSGPLPAAVIKFYWKHPVTITLLFHGKLWKWMPRLPLHGRHRPTEFRGPRPPTSSFRSSDSRALRSSSFRMIALSSAILSWKRRASFSSNCCS